MPVAPMTGPKGERNGPAPPHICRRNTEIVSPADSRMLLFRSLQVCLPSPLRMPPDRARHPPTKEKA